MPRASSAEPPKSSKRKGTRSVSTLTPSQLARKRANDREAQRAIRARTKEHIERLERELDEFRCNQSRDKTVQELLRRNRALEDEVRRLKDSNMSTSMTSSPYSAPAGTDCHATTSSDGPHALLLCQSLSRLTPCPSAYDDDLSVASTMPSPQMSPLPSGPDYAAKDVKMEFEDMHSMAAQGYMHHHQQQQQSQSPHQQHQQRPQAWNMYPMYYEAASPTPCVSR
ncbi:bZIP transcription factor [Ophiocordyceps sinensis CO18]|uniref:BZIP transcription factor n=1 Tax=Ophiocordyceps sinensis (strain Co18 / CGMCC 3.14243) TaxID=911162 RepID=T5A4Y8_OPHSC|nr:bZIP transcription factor [Ophiocordyceps sinensis CO18]